MYETMVVHPALTTETAAGKQHTNLVLALHFLSLSYTLPFSALPRSAANLMSTSPAGNVKIKPSKTHQVQYAI